MSDQTYNITIAVIIGIFLFMGLLLVLSFKYNWKAMDSNKSNVGMPDHDLDFPKMWQVDNILDKNQLSDKDFRKAFGMSRNRYVQKEYGGWKNVDPLDRLRAGNITEEEFDDIISKANFTYKSGKHTMKPLKPKRRYSGHGYPTDDD